MSASEWKWIGVAIAALAVLAIVLVNVAYWAQYATEYGL